jgi:hypothetical protein
MPRPIVAAVANMVSVFVIVFISFSYTPNMPSDLENCSRDIVAISSFLRSTATTIESQSALRILAQASVAGAICRGSTL